MSQTRGEGLEGEWAVGAAGAPHAARMLSGHPLLWRVGSVTLLFSPAWASPQGAKNMMSPPMHRYLANIYFKGGLGA